MTSDDHADHWTTDPRTGEVVAEASVLLPDGRRVHWCGHVDDVTESPLQSSP